MKFTKNRLLSLLLVLAMMLALATVALAATTESVAVTPETVTLAVGDKTTLTATKTPTNGDGNVAWTSSADATASVSDSGEVTAHAVGSATITATVGDKSDTCVVTVVPKYTITVPTTISIDTLPTGTAQSAVEAKLNEALTTALTDSNANKLDTSADWTVSPDFDSSKEGTFTFSKVITLSTENQAKYQINTADNATATVTCTVTFKKAPEVTFGKYYVNETKESRTLNCVQGETTDSKKSITVTLATITEGAKVEYQWYKGTSASAISTPIGSSKTTLVDSATSSNNNSTISMTADVTSVGTTYYKLVVTVSKDGIKQDYPSDYFTVTVKDPYQVVLSKSYTSTSNVVGQYVYYTATLKAYNSTNGSYDITVQSNAFNYVSFSSSDSTKAKIISGATMQTNGSYITLDLYSAGTAKLNATLYPTPNSTSNSMTVPVVGDITVSAAEVSNISMNPTTSTYALIDTTTLVNAIYSATNSSSLSKYITTSSIVFNGNGYGTFSTTGSSGSSSYTFTNTSYASSFYFVPSSSYTGFTSPNMYITYTAYSSDGTIATGKIYFTSASSITYSTTTSTPVYFKASDFSDYFKTALGGTYNSSYYTLSEVTFGTPRVSNSSVTSGTLYYNNGYVYSTTKVPAANLGYVSYTPSSSTYTYTVSIPFTAYGTYYYGSTATKTVSGTVTIKVNDGHVITMVGTDFKSASIWSDITSKHPGVSYVSFSQPQSTVGKLYYGYTSIASKGSLVSYTDRFNNSNYNYSYANTIKSIDGIYFVPAAGCLDTVTLTYTAYTSATATTGVSDTITFTITKKTASSIFNDVTASNTGKWSADAIDFLARNSIVEGGSYGTFNPNGNMTRGDFVLMLYRMAGKPSVSGISNPFTDVKSTDYYYNAILWAYRNDIVTGVDAKTFAPKKNITREQIAATLYRMAGSPSTSGYLTGYYDYAKIHSYATNAMRWAISNGVITGSNGYLTPTNNATRAQVAAMLHRYLTK